MGLDIAVDIHPEHLEELNEVERILAKIDVYEKATSRKAGVVIRQNRQLGGSYIIVSEQEAAQGLKEREGCEWYVKYFSRSYFEDLSKKLQ